MAWIDDDQRFFGFLTGNFLLSRDVGKGCGASSLVSAASSPTY